jgi:hypothetical protein
MGEVEGYFYFFISLKTYREYLTREKHNVLKKNFTVKKTLVICIGIYFLMILMIHHLGYPDQSLW